MFENIAASVFIMSYTNHYFVYHHILQMPVMDGIESAKQMREFENQNELSQRRSVILGISANSEESIVISAKNAGMNAFLTKPFRIQNLIEVYENFKKLDDN